MFITVFVFFFGSFGISKILGNSGLSSIDDNAEMPDNYYEFIDSNDTTPIMESVDCADMNSTMSRGLKLILSNKVNAAKALDVRLYYSSRREPKRVQVSAGDKFTLDRTDFNIERRTMIIVHGFLSGGSQNWIRQMEDAIHLWDDVNVFVADWSAIGKTINYYKAAMSTRIVGGEIARFLNRVVDSTMESSSFRQGKLGKLHFIGHSLGSHISGVAAYDFQRMQKHWRVYRITGLDPALPCFVDVPSQYRLDPTDAQFVDVIHTSSSEKLTVGFGNSEPLGHVDFYPNGGVRQPGCSRVQGSVFNYLWIPKTPVSQGTCSHARSQAFFTESLINAAKNGCKFWARKWDQTQPGAMKIIAESCDPVNCTEMGIRAENYPHRGCFFVTTSKKSPYCVTNKQSTEEIEDHLQEEDVKAGLKE